MATSRIRDLCVKLQQRLPSNREGEEPRWLVSLLLSLPAQDSALLTAINKRRDGDQVLRWFLILVHRSFDEELPAVLKTVRSWCQDTGRHKLLDIVDNFERCGRGPKVPN
jgi:hypothetical protein